MTHYNAGSVVLSLRGKDRGRVMMVVSCGAGDALVCDGRKRKIEKPKRKNLCHLRLLSDKDSCLEADAELTNKRLWKKLEPYRRALESERSDKATDLIEY